MRALMSVLVLALLTSNAPGAEPGPRTFSVWAASCSHVPADIRRGRESLALAIRQSEGLVAARDLMSDS